ncbi:MAG: hypothetical protein JNG85_00495 [Spirochaetaceae bacterium]|nr:hypothetical protein [Spirochaetaceae bacterium]
MSETVFKARPDTRGAAGPYEAASLLSARLAGFGFDPEPSIRVESSGEIFLESSAPDAEPLSLALREIAESAFPAAITGLSFRLEANGALALKLEAIHAR